MWSNANVIGVDTSRQVSVTNYSIQHVEDMFDVLNEIMSRFSNPIYIPDMPLDNLMHLSSLISKSKLSSLIYVEASDYKGQHKKIQKIYSLWKINFSGYCCYSGRKRGPVVANVQLACWVRSWIRPTGFIM